MTRLVLATLVGLVLTGCTALPPLPPPQHAPSYGYVVEPVELRRLEPRERTVFPLFKDKRATKREFYVDQYGREYEVDSYEGRHRR